MAMQPFELEGSVPPNSSSASNVTASSSKQDNTHITSDALNDATAAASSQQDNTHIASDAWDNTHIDPDAWDNTHIAPGVWDDATASSSKQDKTHIDPSVWDDATASSSQQDNTHIAPNAWDDATASSSKQDNTHIDPNAWDDATAASSSKQDKTHITSDAWDDATASSSKQDKTHITSDAWDDATASSSKQNDTHIAPNAWDDATASSSKQDKTHITSDAWDDATASSSKQDNTHIAPNAWDDATAASSSKQDKTHITSDAWDDATASSSKQNDTHIASDAWGDAAGDGGENSGDPFAPKIMETADLGALGTVITTEDGQQKLVSRTAATHLESPKANCIVDFDGNVCGYSEAALRSLGRDSEGPATTVTQFTIVGAGILPAEIRIRHVFQYHGKRGIAVLITVPITALISEPAVSHYAVNDPVLRSRLMKDNAKFECRDGARIQLDLDMSSVWVREVSTPPDRYPQLQQDIKDFIKNIPTGSASMSITMAPQEMYVSEFLNLVGIEYNRHQDPMDNIWSRADAFFSDPKNPKQLNYATMKAGHERDDYPSASIIAFHDDKSRMLSLQHSSYEEFELEARLAIELGEVNFDTVLVPDITSKWSSSSGLSYGAAPDDTICTYLAVIRNATEHQLSLLPDIGQSFFVILDIEDPEPRRTEMPRESYAGYQLKVINYLIGEATRLNESYKSETLDVSASDQEFATTRRDAEMCHVIASTLPWPINDYAVPDGLDEDEAKLNIALTYIDSFFPTREDDDAWVVDIETAFGPIKLTMPITSMPTTWPAVRTRPPVNTPSQYVYLVIHTPRERDWPEEFVAPPMAFRIPCANLVGSLEHSLQNAESTLGLRMEYKPSEVTVKLELAAVSCLAVAPLDTFKGAAWAYAAKFDISVETDLTQRFPQLDNFDVGPVYEPLQNAMSKCPSSMLVYSGGPGSGKTTFALSLVRCLVNDDDFKAVWTVHSNELCDDACDKLHEVLRGTDKKVFRVYPMRRMLAALKGKLPVHDSSPLPQNQTCSPAASAVANHVCTLVAADEKEHPLTRADSLVVYALNHVEAGDVDLNRFTRLRELPSLSKEDDKTLTAICYRFLSLALAQATVIVGTPVALGQIARDAALKHPSLGKWQPAAIFADEIGRMPEAQFWIPIAFFNAEFVVATGDTRQFKPMSKSLDNHNRGQDGAEWRSVFGPQRVMSFLRRVEKTGALASQISINRRNIGGIANWARMNIYSGQMAIECKDGHLVELFRTELNRILRAKSTANSFIIDIREGEELQMGTSFTNQANRNYVFDLLFRLFVAGFPSTRDFSQQGTIMIIVPYTAQLYEYNNEWKAYKVNDAMRSRVLFRTVDDSMSAEADVVIFDTVRTVKLGFIPNTQRMAVATTRARGAMVTLLSTKNWEKGKGRASSTFRHNHMVSYYNYHVSRQAVVTSHFRKNGWTMVCGICGLPDHVDSACTSTRQCKKCNVVHTIRFCPQGFVAFETYNPNRRHKQKGFTNVPGTTTDVAAPKDVLENIKLSIARNRKQIANNTSSEQGPKLQTEDTLNRFLKMHRALHAIDPSHAVPDIPQGVTGTLVPKAKVLGEEDGDDQSEIEEMDIVEAEGKGKGVDNTFDSDGGKW